MNRPTSDNRIDLCRETGTQLSPAARFILNGAIADFNGDRYLLEERYAGSGGHTDALVFRALAAAKFRRLAITIEHLECMIEDGLVAVSFAHPSRARRMLVRRRRSGNAVQDRSTSRRRQTARSKG